jgi:hypothetical protein
MSGAAAFFACSKPLRVADAKVANSSDSWAPLLSTKLTPIVVRTPPIDMGSSEVSWYSD